MKKALIFAVLLCLQAPALAAEPITPPKLVEAIARQESGLNPLAVNVAGKSFYPATREEAENIIRQAQAAGKSFDVGIMQINSWWMERLNINPVSLLDPATNEYWGKWILKEEISRHGLNWQAVGKYHSPDTERGRRYAWLVYYHYAGQGASTTQKETSHAKQETRPQNLSDTGRTRTGQGISQQSGLVPFHIQQKSVSWVFRPQSGAAGGKD